jgi:hypothetical protein
MDALAKKTLARLGTFTTFLSGVTGKTGFQGGAITEVGIPHARADSSPPAAYVTDVPLWQTLFRQWYTAADSSGLWVTAWASGPNWGDYNLGIHTNDSTYSATGTNIDKMMSPGGIDVVESFPRPDGTIIRRGVNLAGGEFGHKQAGFDNAHLGTFGVDYFFPSAGDIATMAARRIGVVRLPISWERLQPTLLGALDSTYLGRITAVADACLANNVGLILDLHNYARYEYSDSGTKKVLVLRAEAGIDLASTGPTSEDGGKIGPEYLVDVWRRLSNVYRTHLGVVAYELMNEPHDVPAASGSFSGTTLNNWNDGTVQSWAADFSGATVTHTTTTPYEGSGALRIAKVVGSSGFHLQRAERGSVSGSGNILRGRVRLNGTPSGTWQARFEWQNASYAWQNGTVTTLVPGTWVDVTCDFASNPITSAQNLCIQIHSNDAVSGQTITVDLDLFERGAASGSATAEGAWESITQAVVADLRTRTDDTTKRDTKLVLVPGMGWNVLSWNHSAAWITEPAGLEGSHRYVTHQYFDSQSNGFGEGEGVYQTSNKRYADAKTYAVSQGYADDTGGVSPTLFSLGITSITANGATVSWSSNVTSDTRLEYGASNALVPAVYGASTARVGTLTTSHVVNLSGLSPNTTYQIRGWSRDAGGNATAITGSFTTLASTSTPGLLWSDEFDSLSLATDAAPTSGTWRTRGYESGGTLATGYQDYAGLSWNTSPVQHPAQNPFSVADSVLTVKAQRTPAGVSNVGGATWMGGYLVTNHQLAPTPLRWRFGYFEWRARMPNPVRGMFPALWLFNNISGRSDGKEGAELDAFEVFGNSTGRPWAAGWHNNPTPGVSGNAGTFDEDVTGWHRYGVEWTATAVRYYRDGILKAELTGTNATWFATADLGVRIDMVMDPNWEAPGSPLRSTTTDPPLGTEPRLEVDYVRVFDAKPSPFPTGSDDPLASGGGGGAAPVTDLYGLDTLSSGPWGYYRLNESTGAVCFDSSGNERHGTYAGLTLLGQTGLLTDNTDKAVSFSDGLGVFPNGYAFVSGASSGLANTPAWTLEGIVNTLNNPGGHRGYFGFRAFGNGDAYVLHLQATNKLEVRFTNSSGTEHTLEVAVTPSARTHIHMVYTGALLQCYVNGVLGNLASGGTQNAQMAASGVITRTDVDFTIGRTADFYAFTKVDEVAIYRTAFSPQRVADRYQMGIDPPVGVIFEDTFGGAPDSSWAVTDTTSALAPDNGYLRILGGSNTWGDPRLVHGPHPRNGLTGLAAVVGVFRHTNAPGDGPGLTIEDTAAAQDPIPNGIARSYPAFPPRYYAGAFVTDRYIPYSNTYLHAIFRRPGGGYLMVVSGNQFGTWPQARIAGLSVASDDPANVYVHLTAKEILGGGTLVDRVSLHDAADVPSGALTRFGLAHFGDTFTRGTLGTTAEEGGAVYTLTGTPGITSNRLSVSTAWDGIRVISLPSRVGLFQVKVVTGAANNGVSILFRYGSSWLEFYADTTLCGIYNGADGSPLTQTGAYHLNASSTHVLSLYDDGAGVRAYIDQQDVTGYVATVLNAANTGIAVYLNTGSTVDEWGAWPETITLPEALGPFPSAPIATAAPVVSDSFTGTAGTALTTYSSAWETTGGSWVLNAGGASLAAAAQTGTATRSTGSAGSNHAVSAAITLPNTTPAYAVADWYAGVVARYAGSNYIYARYLRQDGSNEVEVWEQYNGVSTLIGYVNLGNVLAPGSTHTLTLAVRGGEVAAYHDGELVVQAATSHLTGTRAGIAVLDTNPNGRPVWDDFSIRAVLEADSGYGIQEYGGSDYGQGSSFASVTFSAAGVAGAVFTASYRVALGGSALLRGTGAGVTSFVTRVRKRATGVFAGAAATSFTARGTSASALRAIIQARGSSQALFQAQLRDVTPPQIIGLTIAGITSTGAMVIFSTDEPVSSVTLRYNQTGVFPFDDVGNWGSNLGTFHTFRFGLPGGVGINTPLIPNTTYYIQVTATDLRGNVATSPVLSFTTLLAPPKHRFYVDWSADGDFADSYEEVTGDLLFMQDVAASRGRDQIRQLAPPAAGNYSATLDNRHRRYSPANAESPLATLLEPGRATRWSVEYGGTTYNLFTGVLDNIPQQPAFGRQTVGIPALGTLSRLRGNRITTGIYQNIATHTALGYLLDAAGWPAGDRVISTGSTVLDWWWLDDQDAFTAMVELLSMEGPGAAVYEDGSGRIVFEGRTYRLLQPRCTTVQAVFTDTGPEPWRSPELGYEPGLKDVVNVCSVEVNVRAAATSGVVWQLGQSVSLGNSEVKGYTVRPTDPFQAAITPVAGTDFTIVSGSIASVSLTRTAGATTTIFLTAGSGGASVSNLQLRAQSIPITNKVVMSENAADVKTIASVTKRGRRTYPLPLRRELNPEVARDFCNVVVQRYREPRPQVTITVPCVTQTTTLAALNRQISDRIAVQDQQSGISMPMHIEQIRWEWRQGTLYAIFGCEQASSESYAIWGSAIWDTSLWAF